MTFSAVISIILIFAECIMFGIGNVYMNVALQSMPATLCYATRSLIAFVCYLIFFGKHIFKSIKKEHILPCTLISCCMTGAMISGSFSLKYAEPSTAGFLISIAVIFSPFFSFLLLRKKTSKMVIIPIVLTVAGMYFLCGGGLEFTMGFGEIMGVLCSVIYSMTMVLSEKYVKYIDVSILSFFQTGIGALICFVISFFTSDIPILFTMSPSNWYTILYLGVFCSFAAFYFQNFALRHISSNLASILFTTESIFTASFAFIILGDDMTLFEILGSVLILAGVTGGSLINKKTNSI
ncbi:MAG: DMT family transporter [Clostridia bacterium]|nr:DMT family transporter [Clostridia bacterium]